MTGYGRSEISNDEMSLVLEVKSLNSRYFEIISRIPSTLSFVEDEAARRIKKQGQRGRFTLTVKHEFINGKDRNHTINKQRVKQYQEQFADLAAELNIEADMHLADFINLPDVLSPQTDIKEDAVKTLIKEALNTALFNLDQIRISEGKNLQRDIHNRVEYITEKISEIETLDMDSQSIRFTRLKDRVQQILGDLELDENRIYQEIAIQTEKRDITEELVRLKSHMSLFLTYFNQTEPVGKMMNFLLQEINREMNTIGSKTDSHKISHIVVDIKKEAERIREQVQNIL